MSDDNLAALRAMSNLISAVVPGDLPKPDKRNWVYPIDGDKIKLTTFPLAIVSEGVNQTSRFTRATHGSANKEWSVLVKILVQKGSIESDRIAEEAERKHRPWPDAVMKAVLTRPDLYGEVLSIGRGANWFDYVVGNQSHGLNQPLKFWGIRFLFPVTQRIKA